MSDQKEERIDENYLVGYIKELDSLELEEYIVQIYLIVASPREYTEFLQEIFKWKNIKIENEQDLRFMIKESLIPFQGYNNPYEQFALREIRRKIRSFIM